jgi:hypothetical protein
MATEPGGGAASTPPSPPGFAILGVAGRGGMGVVYRAEQASPRRVVALKLLSKATATPDRLAAFRREAEVVAGLEHPYIVPLYGFGEHAGQPYLVMRYLRGGTAADRLAKGGPVDFATAAGWVKAVAAALDFAHQRGLVHRDVKPSNILLDEAGNAYLTDFGIAGTLAGPESGQATGSAAYMAPEQGRGQAIDRRADIYALAVTLFELLTGQKPYTAETPLGVIVRHIHDAVPSARALNPAIPPAVDALIQRGMAKEKEARPQSAGALAHELAAGATELATATPATDGPHPSAPSPAEMGRRGRGAPETVRLESARAAQAETIAQPAAGGRRGGRLWVVAGLAAVGVCLLGGLAMVGGGVGLAALLGGATATPRATATRVPPTAAATQPAWLAIDDFSDPASGFQTPADEDGGIVYADGVFRMTMLREGVEWLATAGRVAAADVQVSVEVRQQSGPARNELAVVCRYQDRDNYVALGVSADGQAAIWQRRAGDTRWLVDWTEAPGAVLETGTARVLEATCAGDRLALALDGEALAEATDPAPASGDVGLLAGLRAQGEMVAEFDDLLVTAAD